MNNNNITGINILDLPPPATIITTTIITVGMVIGEECIVIELHTIKAKYRHFIQMNERKK